MTVLFNTVVRRCWWVAGEITNGTNERISRILFFSIRVIRPFALFVMSLFNRDSGEYQLQGTA
jgi:hypothetical protein